jgi:hypothetical protein
VSLWHWECEFCPTWQGVNRDAAAIHISQVHLRTGMDLWVLDDEAHVIRNTETNR